MAKRANKAPIGTVCNLPAWECNGCGGWQSAIDAAERAGKEDLNARFAPIELCDSCEGSGFRGPFGEDACPCGA